MRRSKDLILKQRSRAGTKLTPVRIEEIMKGDYKISEGAGAPEAQIKCRKKQQASKPEQIEAEDSDASIPDFVGEH